MAFMNVMYNPSSRAAADLMEAVGLNSEGLALFRAGDYAGAEVCHQQALDLKLHASGPDDVGVALSRNALGEQQLRQGKLAEAEENLKEAVRIRNGRGPAFDAAVSRENLAQVYEAQGRWTEAREIRKSRPNQMSCANYDTDVQIGSTEAMLEVYRRILLLSSLPDRGLAFAPQGGLRSHSSTTSVI
ncbi:hypothetical protein FRB99_007504 [Tulasnella sp. 403]|nr:hypothetical protein FRB99_007504 [Tulasnella sp. 403]